jgi:hypothetical protein
VEQLLLLHEAKIYDVSGEEVDPRLEASGVLAKDGVFYGIFDHLADIACLGSQLSAADSENRSSGRSMVSSAASRTSPTSSRSRS